MIRRNGIDCPIVIVAARIDSANLTIEMLEDSFNIKFSRMEVVSLMEYGTDALLEKLRKEDNSGLGVDLTMADTIITNASQGYHQYKLNVNKHGRVTLNSSIWQRIIAFLKNIIEQDKKQENGGQD